MGDHSVYTQVRSNVHMVIQAGDRCVVNEAPKGS